MSTKTESEYECPICQSMNHVHLRKPGRFQSSVIRHSCEVCETNYLIRFSIAPGKPDVFAYQIIESGTKVSVKGQEILNENKTKSITVSTTNEGVPNANTRL
jgi:transposase-like protein